MGAALTPFAEPWKVAGHRPLAVVGIGMLPQQIWPPAIVVPSARPVQDVRPPSA
jgi:hypothetical protein